MQSLCRCCALFKDDPMIRRIIRYIAPAAILCLLLSGCGHAVPSSVPDSVVIEVTIETPDDVFQTALEYWSGDAFLGGMACCHADGSALDKSETVSFILDPECFPDGTIPPEISVAVMLADDLEHMSIQDLAARVGLSAPLEAGPFPAEPGCVISIKVEGSFADGFSATLI